MSKALADEKLVKRGKGGHRCTRRTDLHACARRRIGHPGGYLDDQPGLCLYRGNGAVGTLFNNFKGYSPTKQCMPTIVDDAILPEMGRMNVRSVSDANPGCSPAPTAAAMYTLIGTAKLNDIDPQAWLADVLDRIADLPQTQLHELLPWHWKAERQQALAA